MTAVEGDGYDENKSPHSEHEKFEGITVGRAALVKYSYFISRYEHNNALIY